MKKNLDLFLEMYQKNEPSVAHDQIQQLKPLMDLHFLTSLDSMLKTWDTSIQVHLPDVRDESSSIDTTAKDASSYFDQGMGLLFKDVQTLSPLLQEWIDALRKKLSLSSLTYGRCLVYATPDGKGTAPHFDQNINFVLQIHGTKKWIMAPNSQVTNPMTRHTMGQPTDPELMTYMDSPMPIAMPDEIQRFELKPGSLLYVPRGYWHSTEAEGNALSLNFTFTAPTWLDLFNAALRSRLALSPEWREIANMKNEEDFEDLLSLLVEDLPNWKASDILEATESN